MQREMIFVDDAAVVVWHVNLVGVVVSWRTGSHFVRQTVQRLEHLHEQIVHKIEKIIVCRLNYSSQAHKKVLKMGSSI